MGNLNFKLDLDKIGLQGEKHVTLELIKEGSTLLKDNDNKEYDLRMLMPNGVEMLLEVKTDVLCTPDSDTGNMFIEFECRGEESGIKVTKAEHFVYYYPFLNQMWFIKVKDLIFILNNNDFRTTTMSGDKDSNTKGYLLGREWFRKAFKVRETNYEWEI